MSSSCAFISVGAGMHDVDVQPTTLQAACGLQTEQAAADDDRLRPVLGLGDHAHAVVEGAESEDAVGQGLVVGPQPGIGGKNDRLPVARISVVVPGGRAVVGMNQASRSGRCAPPAPRRAGRSVVGVPVQRVQIDLGSASSLPASTLRQQDPVVVAVRFVTEHRDVELLATAAHRISSMARTPAMPLPTTTSFARIIRSPPVRGRRSPSRCTPLGPR